MPIADSSIDNLFCFISFWPWPLVDLTINRINGQCTLSAPAKFHWNSLNNNRENGIQQICKGCVLMTLTINLWINLFPCQVISITDQTNLRKIEWYKREIADYTFSSSVTLWPLTLKPTNVYSCCTTYYLAKYSLRCNQWGINIYLNTFFNYLFVSSCDF